MKTALLCATSLSLFLGSLFASDRFVNGNAGSTGSGQTVDTSLYTGHPGEHYIDELDRFGLPIRRRFLRSDGSTSRIVENLGGSAPTVIVCMQPKDMWMTSFGSPPHADPSSTPNVSAVDIRP